VSVASAIAGRESAEALVTGDSLGQVASQTLHNLAVVEEASELPLLRPLLTLDKAEIIEQARELGTLEIAHLPDEDCCQLFSSRQAETRADLRALKRLERLVDAPELTQELADSARLVRPGEEERRSALPARVPAVV
jgi:thiamine biosynthesis protein ThiI